MSKYRRAARIDDNQREIVDQLRQIPGVSVVVGHDDILVGYKGKTYWYEIKSLLAANKDGKVRPSKIKQSQKDLLENYTGHYRIITSVLDILDEIL